MNSRASKVWDSRGSRGAQSKLKNFLNYGFIANSDVCELMQVTLKIVKVAGNIL